MLTITPPAMTVIERITGHPRLEPTSGLRIARPEDPTAPFEVRAVNGPTPGDRVVEHNGGRLYLGPHAARRVDGSELDAVSDDDGRVQFILRAAA